MRFSIEDLVCGRKLGTAEPGMTRAAIRAALGSPDQWMEQPRDPNGERSPIWRYGTFEVHFHEELAIALFTDYLSEVCMDAGPGRSLEPWLLRDPWQRTLDATTARLRAASVRFVVRKESLGSPVVRVEGGADLSFTPDGRGDFEWSAICAHAPGWARELAPW